LPEMLCYNVPIPGWRQPPLDDESPPPVGPAGVRTITISPKPVGRVRFGLLSVLLHMAALASVIVLMRVSALPRPPEEPAAEMVFEPPAEVPAAAPVVDAPPPQVQAPEPPEPSQPEAPTSEPMPLKAQPSLEPPPPTIVPEPIRPPPTPVRKPLVKPSSAQVAPAQAVHRNPPITVPGPVAPAPTVPPPAAPALVDSGWQASLAGWLASRKTYPEEARQHGEEGRVVVRFTIERSGHVIEANIVGSSGSERLDDATLALLRNATLPAFPPSMPQARITITTSVRYTLR
jgi:periplasmic protein TonB